MNTRIFYFSATGNSLTMARKIAEELGDTTLTSIPEILGSPIKMNGSRIGLVFPVYAWGMPRMMTEFVEQLDVKTAPYVFAIASCGGTMGGTLRQLQHMLRRNGGKLHAGFAVRNASNSSMKRVPVQKLVQWLGRNTVPKSGAERIQEIAAIIRQQQYHAPETSAWAANMLGTTLIHSAAMNVFKTSDKGFRTDENCTLCGTCEHLCPRQNIRIEQQNVTWHQNCEFCLACLNWCPQSAIRHENEVPSPKRYHHPEVKVTDMMKQRRA